MKYGILLILVMLLTFQCLAQEKSFKRGVSYGSHSAADMNTASAGISWWYNWGNQPDLGIRTTYSNYNVDYTPMAWNAAGINGVNMWVSQDNRVKYILGFNEPNFKDQANMTPTQAAAAWPQLQAIADKYGLKLVSPAVNYCGNCVSENGTVYTNPFKWLDDFFAACPGCRVDYIALHWYGGGNSMMSYVNDARKYGKPIWITEFADWENTGVTPELQKNYLAGTTNFLERDPDVFRYSWFIGRGPGATTYPYLDLYGADGQMTALGQLYLDIPVYDSTKVFQLPGRIEAEEYYRQSGIFSELTKDIDGFMNIGYTDNGDWLKYKISVPATGAYTLTGRYAGTSAGKFDVYADDVKKGSISTTNTSGWQNWASASTTINLEAGEHILKLLVTTKGFNLNWIGFTSLSTGINGPEASQPVVNIYPNPVTDKKFRVTLQSNPTAGIEVKMIDLSGKTVYSENITTFTGNTFDINLADVPAISKGIYTLILTTNTGTVNRKIVLF